MSPREAPVTDTTTHPRPAADRLARIVFWIATYLFLFFIFLKVGQILWVDPEMPVRRTDFLAFWGAARLALAGEALAAFDHWTLLEASGYTAEDRPKNLLWLYPPGYLALIAPLGALPFWAAWCAFIAVSWTALGLAARAPAAPLPGGWRLVVASPVMLMGVLQIGQTSALWTAGLIAALWSLQRGRPAVAGLCLALLTLKPQLGLLIPFALLAAGHWRAIGWGIAFTLPLVIAPTLLFGAAYWPLFAEALGESAGRLAAGTLPIERLVSVYGFLRAIGAGHELALPAQWAATGLLALATTWAWSRRALGPDLKAALLCAAIPLATPYAFYYEMTLTIAAGMFLYRDGFGRDPAGAAWLFLVWFGPIPGVYLPAILEAAAVGPPIAAITLAICLLRAWRRTRAAPATRGSSKGAQDAHEPLR